MTIRETDFLFGLFPIPRGKPKKSIDVVQRSTSLYLRMTSIPIVTRGVLTVIQPDTITSKTTSTEIGGVVYQSENDPPLTQTFSRDEINDMPKVSGRWPFIQKRLSWKA